MEEFPFFFLFNFQKQLYLCLVITSKIHRNDNWCSKGN